MVTNTPKKMKKQQPINALHVIVLNHKSSQAFFEAGVQKNQIKQKSVCVLFCHPLYLFPCVVKNKSRHMCRGKAHTHATRGKKLDFLQVHAI